MTDIKPADIFAAIKQGIASDPSVVKTVNGVFHFKVGNQNWTVDLKNGNGSVSESAPEKADCTITATEKDFVDLMTGKANGQQLFMQGKLKMAGNLALAMKLEKIPRGDPKAAPKAAPKSESAPSNATATGSTGFRSEALFAELAKRMKENQDIVKSIGGIYQFNITGGPNGKTQSWLVDLKNGNGSIQLGEGKADCTITVSDADYVGMMTGKLNSQQLFMQGKLKIQGNMALAMKLGKLGENKSSL